MPIFDSALGGQQPQQSGGSAWEEILKLALPAVAGFYAGHKGQLGPYMQGYQQSQHMVDQQNNQRQQMSQQQAWHQEQIHQQNIDNERQQASLDMQTAGRATDDKRQQMALDSQMAQRDAAQQAAQAELDRKEQERQTAHIQRYFDEAAKDYGTTDFVKKFGKDAFSIDVPGIGPINLQKAMDAYGAVPPANFGTAEPPPVKQPTLINSPGPNGPIRAIDAPGVPVYERPHAPLQEPMVPVPVDGGKAVWGTKQAGGEVYQRPEKTPIEPMVPVPTPEGGAVWGSKTPGGPVYERPRPTPSDRPEPLVPTPGGPKGGAVWGRKKEGAPVYEKPNAGGKPTRKAYIWKDEDPDSDTFQQSFRIVEDGDGNEISKTRITGASSSAPAAPKSGGKSDPLGIR